MVTDEKFGQSLTSSGTDLSGIKYPLILCFSLTEKSIKKKNPRVGYPMLIQRVRKVELFKSLSDVFHLQLFHI